MQLKLKSASLSLSLSGCLCFLRGESSSYAHFYLEPSLWTAITPGIFWLKRVNRKKKRRKRKRRKKYREKGKERRQLKDTKRPGSFDIHHHQDDYCLHLYHHQWRVSSPLTPFNSLPRCRLLPLFFFFPSLPLFAHLSDEVTSDPVCYSCYYSFSLFLHFSLPSRASLVLSCRLRPFSLSAWVSYWSGNWGELLLSPFSQLSLVGCMHELLR